MYGIPVRKRVMTMYNFENNRIKGIANYELTGELMFNIGRAGAYVLTHDCQEKPKVIIGKDTRVSCDMLESGLASGLASMGVDVYLFGVLPAPAISYLTKLYNADAGFMISASCDTYEYNGVKIYNRYGARQREAEKEILSIAIKDWALDLPPKSQLGKINYKSDGVNDYISFVKSTVSTDLKGLKIVVDCANGVNSYIAQRVFEDFGAMVFAINNTPDGININDNCGVGNIDPLKEMVISRDADIGIAFDGEGSLVLIVDEKGHAISGDGLLGVCAMDMFNKGNLKDSAVLTTVANSGFKTVATEKGINVVETYGKIETLENSDYSISGDRKGYVVMPQYSLVGDGLIAVLKFMSILKNNNKTVSMLINDIKLTPQITVVAKVKKENIDQYIDDAIIMSEVERLNNEFGEFGKVIIKPYAKKSRVEVIIEGEDVEYITQRATELGKLLELKYN